MAEILLVHGAWADGSAWLTVIAELHRQRHRVRAVHLPLTSLADDLAVVRDEIAQFAGPVTLAGHSYGGTVISGAAKGNPQVAALAYIAYVPDEGETLLSLNARYPETPGGEALLFQEDGWSSLSAPHFHSALAADLPPGTAAAMAAVQRRTHTGCFTAPAGPAAWHDLPSIYAVSGQDRILHPDLQRWQADRAGSTVVELPASHYSPLSRPAAVADAIARVATAG